MVDRAQVEAMAPPPEYIVREFDLATRPPPILAALGETEVVR